MPGSDELVGGQNWVGKVTSFKFKERDSGTLFNSN